MQLEGGCYCGAIRYRAEGEPMLNAQCHCRECQYLSGGGPNVFMVLPESGFEYTRGTPRSFTRSDLESPVTREFCAECGTHVVTRAPGLPGGVILKVGTLDDPGQFPGPQVAMYCVDKQRYHAVPEGVPEFERVPG
ncbi:MAG: GFA family protein [Pseudomonadota bacterium]